MSDHRKAKYIVTICKQNHELQQRLLELMIETKQLKYILLLHIYGKEGEGKELLQRCESFSGMSVVKDRSKVQSQSRKSQSKAKVSFQEA